MQAAAEIKLALNVVPKQDKASLSSQKRAANQPLGPQGSIFISEHLKQLNLGEPFSTSLKICNTQLDVCLQVIQNEITKQPNRVIEVAFHRLIKLSDTDFIASKFPKAEQQPNNISMVLIEQPCIN